ncbi:MAG: 2Fe-2S ferredoxin [Rickettsiales bacterium]|nr:2Fe-2S ferredoxin [Rickettsiales bacterium]OUV52903.1 MAG: 2Fe-2S ferredoxin [Rickettsiales bacterium TMED127]|tara:strand:- start:2687 stop:3022 length:336 start_codon:yes stop_codon:yes gene_type:complete
MPKVIFIDSEGVEKTVEAEKGLSILEVAHKNGIDLEGACEGSLACATCHVILEKEIFDSLNEPTEEEEDMLDLAFGLTHTSRLGCQIIINDDLDGIKIKLPSGTRNMSVDK